MLEFGKKIVKYIRKCLQIIKSMIYCYNRVVMRIFWIRLPPWITKERIFDGMNASSEKELLNPWDQRAEFAPVAPRNTAFSLVVVFLCALAIPLTAFYESISLLILAALFCYVVSAVRAPFAVTMLLGTAFLTVSLTQSLALGAVVLALVVGTGAMAFLLTAMNSPFVSLLSPTAAACVSYVMLGDWRISLLSFGFLPAAILLAVATRLGKDRTTAVCFAQVGLLAVLALGIGYVLYTESVARGISIPEYVSLLKDSFFEYLLKMRDESGEGLQELTKSANAASIARETYPDEYIRALVGQTAILFPALCGVFCGVIAFQAQILLNGIYRNVGWKQVLSPRSMVFTMSLTAAVIYFGTFLLSMLPLGTSTAALVIVNLNTLLLPGFLVIGFTMLMLSLSRAKSGARSFWILLIGGLLCCRLDMAFPLLSLFGANSVVLGAVQQKMKDKSQNGSGNTRN